VAKPEESSGSADNVAVSRDIDEFGKQVYADSALLLRQVGLRMAFSVFGAVLLWLVGRLVLIPMAEEVNVFLFGYPLTTIVSVLVAVALAIITILVFVDVHRLSGGLAGITAYQFGKATGELRAEEVNNYKIALDGVLYVIVVTLTYLLFFDYLAYIHRAIPAVLLVLIVIWAIYALWQSTRAIANVIDRYTSKIADMLDEKVAKKGQVAP
jgi:hypothetical protein